MVYSPLRFTRCNTIANKNHQMSVCERVCEVPGIPIYPVYPPLPLFTPLPLVYPPPSIPLGRDLVPGITPPPVDRHIPVKTFPQLRWRVVEMGTQPFITTHKHSLWRLCFYKCSSVHKGGGGGIPACLADHMTRQQYISRCTVDVSQLVWRQHTGNIKCMMG